METALADAKVAAVDSVVMFSIGCGHVWRDAAAAAVTYAGCCVEMRRDAGPAVRSHQRHIKPSRN